MDGMGWDGISEVSFKFLSTFQCIENIYTNLYMSLVRTLVLPRRYLFGKFESVVFKKVPFWVSFVFQGTSQWCKIIILCSNKYKALFPTKRDLFFRHILIKRSLFLPKRHSNCISHVTFLVKKRASDFSDSFFKLEKPFSRTIS